MALAAPLDPASAGAQPAREGARRTRKVLVKKVKPPFPVKKYAWLAGHGLTLFFGLIYFLFYFFRWWFPDYYYIPRINYRLSFIGAVVSYSITTITTFGSNLPNYFTLLATENFQNLLLAGVWLLSRPSPFKLFPYYIVSLLQLSSFFDVAVLLKYQTPLSDIIAFSEILIFFSLFFETLLFRVGSGFALIFYLGFYWLRVNFSPYTQVYILRIVQTIDDKIISKQKPEIQAKWRKLTEFVEFRRSQTKQIITEDLREEPPIPPISTNEPKDKKVIGKTENNQLVGQATPDGKVREGAQPGIHVERKGSDVFKENSKAPAGIAKSEDATYQQNFEAGVLAATSAAGAGVSAGAYNYGAKAGLESTRESSDANKRNGIIAEDGLEQINESSVVMPRVNEEQQ